MVNNTAILHGIGGIENQFTMSLPVVVAAEIEIARDQGFLTFTYTKSGHENAVELQFAEVYHGRIIFML